MKRMVKNEVCGFPKFITVASEDPSFSAVYSYDKLTDESFYGGSQ